MATPPASPIPSAQVEVQQGRVRLACLGEGDPAGLADVDAKEDELLEGCVHIRGLGKGIDAGLADPVLAEVEVLEGRDRRQGLGGGDATVPLWRNRS